jgi:hypothetical protein
MTRDQKVEMDMMADHSLTRDAAVEIVDDLTRLARLALDCCASEKLKPRKSLS